ncbi:MFS general substrate transporter [Penicillium sp. IBT 16267x]|nr:MFS general substrate transporter [Penicillium sp. IBT 16267x]
MQDTTTKESHSEVHQLVSLTGDNAATVERSHEDSTENQLGRGRLALLIIGLGLSVSCVSLDNTILSTAIPKISQHFKTIEDVGWYGSSYFLAICSVNLLFGRLYTFFSTKLVFLAAIILFEVGSLVCGVTPTSAGLIIGRVVAGLGCGENMPGAILMISQNVPLHRRALLNAVIMGMASVAGTLGPLVGGALTEHATWRWCFYINLPVGGKTVLAVVFCYRDPPTSRNQGTPTREKLHSLDLMGVALFISAICCLVLALQWAGSKYAWKSARIITLFILSVVLLSFWTYVQFRKQEKATIPPRLIAQRNVWAATAYAALLSGAIYGMAYYFPIWLQFVKGASPTKSGIMNMPMIIAITVFSLLAGVPVSGIGYYTPVMAIGSILLTIGCGMCATLQPTSGHPKWIGYQALIGMGAGLGYNLPLIAVQTAQTSEDIATATAIIIFGQNLSSTLFIAAAQNVFQSLLSLRMKNLGSSIDPQKVVAMGAADLSKDIPSDVLPLLKLAFNDAVSGTFYVFLAGLGCPYFVCPSSSVFLLNGLRKYTFQVAA